MKVHSIRAVKRVVAAAKLNRAIQATPFAQPRRMRKTAIARSQKSSINNS
jgi:hypothetical protein